MSLPSQAVDRLFARLQATYGRDFTSKFEGVEVNAVKSSWAHELSGFANHLQSLAWALENLPERAPNVIEFRNLARRAPVPDAPRLEVAKAGQDRVQAELAKLGPILAKPSSGTNGKQWARDLIARHEAGCVSASPLPLKMARDALAS